MNPTKSWKITFKKFLIQSLSRVVDSVLKDIDVFVICAAGDRPGKGAEGCRS